ncbi:hypothetical protein D1815_12905 [Aquimarina sp. AD1]|uniref:tetratricopeptide repeat-containing sensor histidine kinase n=3 Tax=Aquimarina sp. (strain AD1) TaxID=1714848 RepID=UPI000E4E5DAF|nr:tetratricopeptide repeat-containing sensor histidine kinase [Aquimarina sp. AD1]AXT56618.1 hypothetical protein D1815_12905 [Aquimarina sp. AD1]
MRLLKLTSLLICFVTVFINCNKNEETFKDKESLNNDIVHNLIKDSENTSKSLEEKKYYLQEAFELTNKLPDNNEKIKLLHKISYSYYSFKEYEDYKQINYKALRISKKLSDSLTMAKSYGNIGIYFRTISLDSSYKNFLEADRIYRNFDKVNKRNPESYAFAHGKILIDLAKLSKKVKDYSQSEDLTIRAIKKFLLSKNESYLPLSYNNLGIIAKQLSQYKDAINYYEKAVEYSRRTKKETFYVVQSYNNIGVVHKNNRKYKEAEESFNKGLEYSDFLKKNPNTHSLLLDNLGYVKFLSGKQSDSALYLLNKAYKIRNSVNDIKGIITNNLHYAEYYKSNNNDSLAILYGSKVKDASLLVNENTELLQAYNLLAQVSPPEQGRKYAMEYIKLNDSLTKRDNLFRDKFARIRFESENLEKENQQKSEEIQEVQNQNTVYLLGILLLATFIGFIIYFSRQRTKYLAQQNKIVEFQAAYETETRISKRLHDEIGNDIFQVMMQYQNDPHDPQITKKLNTAYTKARDISRENSEFEVNETYLEELTDMLTNYTKNNIKLVLRGIDKISWDTVDKNLKITIYRVLQELMTNMQKHSQADLVAIVFKNEKNKLLIKYSDNGVGIQKEDIKSKNGLRNTEKRMLAINGTIVFDSEKSKGFKAEIVIPN